MCVCTWAIYIYNREKGGRENKEKRENEGENLFRNISIYFHEWVLNVLFISNTFIKMYRTFINFILGIIIEFILVLAYNDKLLKLCLNIHLLIKYSVAYTTTC